MDQRTNKLLTEAERVLAQLREHLGETVAEESDDERWFRTQGGAFLNEIDIAGGSVTQDEIRELAKKFGYDPRGIGGFAAGKTPSLRSEGDRRVLTLRGRGEAARWRAMYG